MHRLEADRLKRCLPKLTKKARTSMKPPDPVQTEDAAAAPQEQRPLTPEQEAFARLLGQVLARRWREERQHDPEKVKGQEPSA